MDWIQLHVLCAGGECVMVCLGEGSVVGIGCTLGGGNNTLGGCCNTLDCVVTVSPSLSL